MIRFRRTLLTFCLTLTTVLTADNTVNVHSNKTEGEYKTVNAENVARWAEREFPAAFNEGRFSAAAVAVVKDGKLIFSRGYGYANLASKTPMDPAKTRVRVCSTTKLYVATALMQLLDQGKIKSLDDPASQYIKRMVLPEYQGREITLRDLTTHRGGFEDQFFNAGTREVLPKPSSAKTVQRLIPKQVREPGTLSVYSNANTALQGVIIEDLSGMTLKDYLAENIFQTLGMSHTVFNDNPPIPKGTAQPYARFEDGHYEALPIVAKHPVYAPSGGLYSTAEDMAKFIIAHLEKDQSLLTDASYQTMHSEFTRNHPQVGAIGVQFFLETINGQAIIQHGCGLPGFTSYVLMLPERNVGVFFSVTSTKNRVGGLKKLQHMLRSAAEEETVIAPNRAAKFYWSFLKEFVGFQETPGMQSSAEDLTHYTGHYKSERRAHTTLLAGSELLSPGAFMMHVELHPDGGLSINDSEPYRQIAADVFQRGQHPARILVFGRDDNNNIHRIFRSTAQVWGRVPASKSSHTLSQLFLLGLGICLSGLLIKIWPGKIRSESKWAFRASWVTVSAFILIWVTATMNFLPAKNIEHYVNEGGELRLWILALLCNVIALAGLTLIASAALSWRNNAQSTGFQVLGYKLHLLLLAGAGAALIYAMYSVNLLGFNLP